LPPFPCTLRLQPFPDALRGVRVSSLDKLVADAGCRLAVSCVAPDVGYVDDILTSSGFAVFFILCVECLENA
jgi:hypothetical protein